MCHHTDVCHVLVSWTTVFHIWPQWNVTKLLWLCNIMVCDLKVVANTELWRNGIQKRGNEPEWKHILWRQCHCSHPNYSSVVVSKHDLSVSKLKVISWTYFSFVGICKSYIKTITVWIPVQTWQWHIILMKGKIVTTSYINDLRQCVTLMWSKCFCNLYVTLFHEWPYIVFDHNVITCDLESSHLNVTLFHERSYIVRDLCQGHMRPGCKVPCDLRSDVIWP